MSLTGEKDQFGNLLDSRGFWVGVGENEGEIYPSALGKWISVYDPQADIFMNQPEPKAASTGGGGGSTNPQTIYIQQNPGGLYQTITSDGSDGFPPGTVYQKNQVTGDFNILYKPSAQSDPASLYNDRNGDGYDDQTGLPVGVTKVDKSLSPTGLVYQGKPVNADGSLYTGGGTNAAPDLVNGKYIWNGSKFVVAPGLETPASASGGGSYTISGPKVSSYSGGGGSSSSAADQAAAYAQQTQMQKDAQAFTASQNALDRAQKDAQFQANYGLSVAQFNAQQAAQAKQQKSQDLKDFGNAVSDVDPAQFLAWMYANGFGAGGTIANRIAEGGTAISANALVRAAGLLDSIRNGNQATQYGGGYGGGLGNAGVPGGTTPATTGGTGGLGNTGGTGTPVLPSTQANQGIDPNIAANIAANQQGQADQAYAADKAATLAWYNPANWTEVPGPDMTYGMRYMQSTLTGEKVPIGVWTDMIQNNMGASQKETQFQTFWGGASITPDSGVSYGYNPHYTAKPVDSLGQVSGTAYQTYDPSLPNYGIPAWDTNAIAARDRIAAGGSAGMLPAGNLSGDNIMRALPDQPLAGNPATGAPVGTQSYAPGSAVPDLGAGYTYDPATNRWVGSNEGVNPPKLARGGLAQGPYISGDSMDNRPNPELNIPTPMGNHVIPLRQMPQGLAQQMMANLPKHAEGTVQDLNSSWLSSQSYNPFNDPFARFVPANAVVKPATTAGSSTTTTTPSTPVSSPASPAPAPAVSSTSTGLGNTTPTTTQPTQATQPAPTNAQGQTIQQPTAPSPVTGGLGSITDIVNSGTTTPTSQALLDEILKWRQGQEVLPVNPLSLDFQNLDPYTQQIIYNQRQTKYGIPVAAQQYEVNKYRIPGASRGSLAGGLAW